jgi:hypothetical protein
MTIKVIPCISVNRCSPRSCFAAAEFDDALISVCCQKHRHLIPRRIGLPLLAGASCLAGGRGFGFSHSWDRSVW